MGGSYHISHSFFTTICMQSNLEPWQAGEHLLVFSEFIIEKHKMQGSALTFGVGQEAVERRDVAWARGDSEGVVLREAVSRGSTWTPREMMESGI